MGGLSQDALLTAIELYGTEVIPRVRELLPDSTGAGGAGGADGGTSLDLAGA